MPKQPHAIILLLALRFLTQISPFGVFSPLGDHKEKYPKMKSLAHHSLGGGYATYLTNTHKNFFNIHN